MQLLSYTPSLDAFATGFMSAGFDLGIFDQGVWRYSHFEAAVSSLKAIAPGAPSVNLLGDHFSPIISTLAPFYWVWSDPRVLIVIQALLVASAAFPIHAFIKRRVARRGALLLTCAYLSFWGTLAGVAADFHEVAFAPLLVAVTIWAADGKRWRWYWAALLLLLLVKEDLPIFVVFVGVWLLTVRDVRRGLGTIAVGIVAYVLITKVAIPHFAPDGKFAYFRYSGLGKDPVDALANVIDDPARLIAIAANSVLKVRLMIDLLAAFLFTLFFSRLGVLAIPLIAERVLSDTQGLWAVEYGHYSLTIAPVLVMAAADGIPNALRVLNVRRIERTAWMACGVVAAVNIVMSAARPFSSVVKPSFYVRTPAERARADAVRKIPEGASVAAQNDIAPHLSRRDFVFLVYPGMPEATYAIADVKNPNRDRFPNPDLQSVRRALDERRSQYERIFARDGVVVLRRRSPSPLGR